MSTLKNRRRLSLTVDASVYDDLRSLAVDRGTTVTGLGTVFLSRAVTDALQADARARAALAALPVAS